MGTKMSLKSFADRAWSFIGIFGTALKILTIFFSRRRWIHNTGLSFNVIINYSEVLNSFHFFLTTRKSSKDVFYCNVYQYIFINTLFDWTFLWLFLRELRFLNRRLYAYPYMSYFFLCCLKFSVLIIRPSLFN